jgi:threonine 3-dehydrogenase
MTMRAVVTCGSGFLGSHLARTLAARGDVVICLDVAPPPPMLREDTTVRRVDCDVTSWADLCEAIRDARPDVLFHTAGILSARAEERPRAAYDVNATGMLNVLEAVGLLRVPRLVFTSTIATYGPGAGRTVDETTPQRPTTMYGLTKVLGELLGEHAWRRDGVDYRGIRLPALLGPGRGEGGASAYASLIVSEPTWGRPYVVPVPAATTVPLMYVADAVAALIGIAEADEARLGRRTYGVAGFSATADALADAVRRAIPGADIRCVPDPAIASIVATWPERVDDAEAARHWGWAASHDVDSAVDHFVATLRAGPPD